MKALSTIALALLALAPSWCLGAEPAPASGSVALPDPTVLARPAIDNWPTYNGDYSGRRFSTLTRINDRNVKDLSLAWMYQAPRTSAAPGARMAGTPVVLNGVMYVTSPDKVWALDAHTGKQIWAYLWDSKGGIHLGNRGVAISGNSLFFETPDCHLVSLNVADGKLKWSVPICDLDQMYYASVAPLVVKNHVITGVSGDDLDRPGMLQAHDPETGALQWQWRVTATPGDPGASSWPNEEAAAHGGGMTWISPTYDPDLNLLYVGTGNPQPVMAAKNRPGNNLYTCSIVALNADTGKLDWYFQPSPHDTHDWDAVETPVLFDGEIDGKKHKLLAQASRNGWFFVLDRVTGKDFVSEPFVKTNWAKGVDAKGEPVPDPAKQPQVAGALVAPNANGGVNWPPPSFSPQTGLFYVNATQSYAIYYIFDDSANPEGWGGHDLGDYDQSMLQALDYRTGKVKWSHKWEMPGIDSGLLTTAGNLLFAGDSDDNLIAFNASNGDILWHAGLGSNLANGAITYELDGKQYVVVGAGDKIYAFVLN